MNKDKIRGIYKITNLIDGKTYIGESLDIYRRWDEHKEDLNNNSHHSYKLQQDWNKYGQDNFKFETIAIMDKTIASYVDKYILIVYEDKYIKEYDSIDNGYNIENTLSKILNGDKTIINKYDVQMLDAYIVKINEFKDIVNKDGVIYKPKYYVLNDLVKELRLRHSVIENMFIENKIINKNKRNYYLTEEYLDSEDIILILNSMKRIKFTENGFKYICKMFNKTN